MGLELNELETKIRVAMERSLMAEHAGVAISLQKEAIGDARVLIKDGLPMANVLCCLPASVVISLAELGLKIAEPSRATSS